MGFLLHDQLLLCLLLSQFSLIVVLANSFTLPLEQRTLCHDYEKLALLHFKQSFLVDCLSDKQSVPSYPKMKLWGSYEADETGDCCTWDGVKCDQETGHVTELDLSRGCLFGSFPPNSTLFSLTHLKKLNLAYNDFNFSQIPASIGRLDQLRHLHLSQSAFSGQIPSQISKLSRLTRLDLSHNGDRLGSTQLNLKYNPNLHKLLQNLTGLNELFLDWVDISSNFPISLTNMTSLKVISLMYCNLYGELPASIFQLPNLEVLVLRSNRKITGHLLEFRSSTYPLKILDLSATALSGELPSSIANLVSLDGLRLYGCHFSGTIPSSLGNLTKLTQLSLSANNFEGEIPASVRNLTQLRVLGIGSLKVKTENLYFWLPKLKELTALALGRISVLNPINHDMSFLANLTKISYLDLSENQLTGPIPHWLVNLTQLTWLYLPENQLQGPIPQWFSHLTYLRSLSLSHNNLSGNIDILFELQNLRSLDLSSTSIAFPSNVSIKSSVKQFDILNLDSCNLTEFPQFLRNQNELQFLSLGGNNIKGTIPQWFINISQQTLLILDLSRNSLTGFEQSPLILPWSSLKFLDLSSNRLKGLLPCPSKFTEIYLVSDNQFTGVIPQQLCSVSSLTFLDLSDNRLSGQVPSCLAKLFGSSLIALNMKGNNFRGAIPLRFTSSCKLQMINLSENQLEGELPKSLPNCKMLMVLDVGKNRLNDTFPYWLRRNSKLQVLVLRHNYFHGQIPSPASSHDFPSLHVLDLSYNQHTGALPFEYLQNWQMKRNSDEDQWDSSSIIIASYFTVFDMIYFQNLIYNYSTTIMNKGSERFYSKILNAFQFIDFSSNNFTGQIPQFIGHLIGLRALNLSNNNLDGNIPASLANVNALESLDLSQNKFSGKIPQELNELTSLEVFDVSYNHLKGPIPQGKQFNTFERSSYDGNLGLCGSPLSNKCGNSGSMSPPVPEMGHTSEDHKTPLIDWIVRLSGCFSGFVVGFVIGQYCITDRYHGWFMQTFGRMR